SSSAPHRSLHSFPTRRSSDLEWDKDIDTVLPGPLAVRKVRFRVRRGVRYYYRHLSIQGLKSLSQSEAKAFFVETGFLVSLRSTRSEEHTSELQSRFDLVCRLL